MGHVPLTNQKWHSTHSIHTAGWVEFVPWSGCLGLCQCAMFTVTLLWVGPMAGPFHWTLLCCGDLKCCCITYSCANCDDCMFYCQLYNTVADNGHMCDDVMAGMGSPITTTNTPPPITLGM